MIAGALVVAALLIVVNGVFVAAEFSLLASLRARLEPAAESGRFSARLAVESMGNLGPILAGTQLGVTIASLALGSVGETAVAQLFEDLLGALHVPTGATRVVGVVAGLAVVVFFHLLFGEMVPKSLALTQPERTLTTLIVPVRGFVWVFTPVIWSLNAMARVGARLLGATPADERRSSHTAEEIGLMLAESRDEGLIGAEELERLTGALELVQRPVGELMVPRDRLVAVDRSEGVDDIERLVESSGRSRIIVFDGDLDHIIGFVHAKDLLQVGEESRSIPIPIPLRRHVTVDAMAPLGEVIVEMQTRQIHMAVVSGARTLGIVTLEDILESIVGDIFDETDREAS